MLEAVRQNGYALEYAGPGLKEDRALVLEAVRHTWNALHAVRGSRAEGGPRVRARGDAAGLAYSGVRGSRAEGGPRVHATGVDTGTSKKCIDS